MRHWRHLLVVLAGAATVVAAPAPPTTFAKPRLHVHAMPTRNRAALQALASPLDPITFHGGAVMTGHVNIFVIWYGNWPAASKKRAIITDFARNLTSPYWSINATFPNKSGKTVQDITFSMQTDDAYSVGASNLTDDQIQAVVTNAVGSGRLPKSPGAIYLVLTSADVTKAGFLTEFCGWHSFAKIKGSTLKLAFVGDPTGPKLRACAAQDTSPNGDAGADSMVSTIAHELSEAVTDPTFNGWRTDNGEENADRCAWKFATTYLVDGTTANMQLGTRNFLIQTNWLNTEAAHCALAP